MKHPPVRQINTLSARTAYRDVLGIFAVGAAGSIWNSAVVLAGLCGVPPAAWTETVSRVLAISSTAGGEAWLMALVIARHRIAPRTRRALAHFLGAGVVCVMANVVGLFGHNPVPIAILLAWLSWEVPLRHGIKLTTFTTRGSALRDPRRYLHACSLGFEGLAVLVAMSCLMVWLAFTAPGLVLHANQLATVGIHNTFELITGTFWTSIVEEMVCTGVAVALLRAAHRPAWEWVAIPVLLRLLPHLYLGLASLATITLSLGAVYLYSRYRALAPMVSAHFLFDCAGPDFLNIVAPTVETRVQVMWMALFLGGIVESFSNQRQKRIGGCETASSSDMTHGSIT